MSQTFRKGDANSIFKLRNVIAFDYHAQTDRLVVSLADQMAIMYNLSLRDTYYSLKLDFAASEIKIAPDGSRVLFIDK